MSSTLTEKEVFARVALEVAVPRLFSYRIPDTLSDLMQTGSWVKVPFGSTVKSGCIVMRTPEPDVAEVKDILGLDSTRDPLSPALLELATWISDYYFCPIGLVLKAMVPSTIRRRMAKEKYQMRVFLADDPMDIEGLSLKARCVIEYLKANREGVDQKQIIKDLSVSLPYLKGLKKKGFIDLEAEHVFREPYDGTVETLSKEIIFTGEQQRAFEHVQRRMHEGCFSTVLLHGVTGSGKTEVYLSAMRECLQSGRDAILLVPEIALTPQTMERVRRCFSKDVALLHSRMSHGERYDAWRKIEKGEARVVVGPRSAIFAPLKRVGLVIIDEEHERTYKQEDAPRYHARDVAIMRAKIEKAVVLLGTATPSLESYYNAQKGKYDLLNLTKRVEGRPLPKVKVVDMRREVDHQARFE